MIHKIRWELLDRFIKGLLGKEEWKKSKSERVKEVEERKQRGNYWGCWKKGEEGDKKRMLVKEP